MVDDCNRARSCLCILCTITIVSLGTKALTCIRFKQWILYIMLLYYEKSMLFACVSTMNLKIIINWKSLVHVFNALWLVSCHQNEIDVKVISLSLLGKKLKPILDHILKIVILITKKKQKMSKLNCCVYWIFGLAWFCWNPTQNLRWFQRMFKLRLIVNYQQHGSLSGIGKVNGVFWKLHALIW